MRITLRERLAMMRPHMIHLCVHCRQNPAGFWVYGPGARTARRPWCLSCLDGLDCDGTRAVPFGP